VGSHQIFHVPSEAPSIFQAVQLAQDGDTILVAPGTYFEQISFQGKAITIASTSGPEVTILDGQGFQSLVAAFQNEGPGSVLRGFTITHAQNGAVIMFGASPTIENNIITENSGCFGTGIRADSSAPIIRHNIISNNVASNCFTHGGGIWIEGFPVNGGSAAQILNNAITGNQLSFIGDGGGIAVSDGANANIIGNTIQNNSTGGNGGGVAIRGGAVANLVQNLITGNSAGNTGGGVYAFLGSSGDSDQLINNTIADNVAFQGTALFLDGSDGSIVNNLLVDSTGSPAVACSPSGLSGNFSFNDVFGIPGTPVYGPTCGDQTNISGNVRQDPQFVNSAGGNYRLQPSSPAIDAGNNFPGASFGFHMPERDLDGNGRIGPGNAGTCTGIIDLGAYEFALGPNGTPGPLPASWDFGSGLVGFSGTPFVFNVTAQGCVPVASIKTTGDFQQTNTCSGAVSDTRSCTISVSFNPQHLGPATGLLTVDFGPSTPPATVSLTGEGVAIPPSVSPSGLNFGFQLVGTSSPPQQVFLFGNFTGLINVNAIWISGDFSQTNQCAPPFGVFTSGGCVINVVFTPTAAGNGRGTLTVSTNQGVVAIPLTGQIDGGGNISLSPTSLVFPSQRVGTPSGPQTITLSNNTSTSAALQLVNVSGDFTLDSSQCHVSSLLPGQACSFNIAFNPTVLGTRTGTFTVQAGSQTLTASLSGIGLAPQASVSPTALQFGNQVVATASAAQTVTVANSGNAGLNIASISATGDFTQSNNCVIVAPGSNCSINVVFTPTVLGSRSGTLKIVSDDGTFTVPLSGNGMNQAATASPAALNFSSALLNVAGRNQTVILTAGINALQITSISASGDFNVTSNCGASLPTGGACSIQVTFVPTSAGQRTGTLTVNSNEGAITSLLSGSGLARAANTIYVPADQPTIQAAIDSSTSGRTVSVLPGTYVEHIDFHGKAIMVSSTDGPGFTTIDGSLTATVVSFATAEGPSSVLHGFTITRGSSMFGGSGITIASASPVVENNLITGNQGCGGIGINISGGSATIRNNTISNNIQTICSGGNGGGIGVAGGSPQILNNLITGNRLPGGAGGGVSLNGSSTTISGNTIQGNSASNQGGGISIINAGNSTVVQNLITDNSAGGNGGGIYWGVPSGNRGPFVVNNTIANNTASSGSAAFSDGFFANVVVSNNILIGKAGSVAFVCSSLFSGTPPIVIANDAFSSGAPGYGDACAGQIGGNGNISSDPQFVNSAAADYRLQAGSPAIDAGSNQAPNLPANDLSGNPRISFGSANTCSNIVDMGVYEFVLTTAPGFGMSPASIDFGIQPVGTASAAQTLTVSATQGCVVPPSISVSGDFSQTNSCHFVLPTGGSCTIQVIFNPTAGGLRSGVVNVSSGTNTATATVSGQGGVATAVLSPTALDFGNQPVSTNSAQKSVTLTNGGNIPLVISGISVTGDFAQTDSCPASLNPGASCTISVVFTPFTLGSRAGALVVSGNAATASAGLAGVGTARLLSASPGSLTFLAQLVGTTSAAQSVTLTNNGNLPTSILGITIAGDFLQTNNCGATLAAGASCVVNVTFKPVARLARTGSLTVQSDASTPTVTVGLSGTGVAPVAALTASLTFAPQVVGTSSTQNATLSNNGDATLNISSILASGDFSPSSACGSSLAAGSSCVITVRFTPTVSGTRTGSVVVTDSDPAAGSQTVALSGTGLDFSISATPASVTVRSGQTANYTATVGALGGAFNGAVSLSCGGLPAGASCTFSPASVTPGSSGASSALSIATSNGQHGTRKTPAGTYTITVQGVSGSLAHSTTVKLVVQ
jgi:hypothetical protein